MNSPGTSGGRPLRWKLRPSTRYAADAGVWCIADPFDRDPGVVLAMPVQEHKEAMRVTDAMIERGYLAALNLQMAGRSITRGEVRTALLAALSGENQ